MNFIIMRILILALVVLGALCHEMLVTKEYTDYLKRHVSWEVMDYEENIFRGWTLEEGKVLLGLKESNDNEVYATTEERTNLPKSVNWANSTCDSEIRNQGNCGSCWAFATVGMLNNRCCQHKKEAVPLLSPQELVSCDPQSDGCDGGWCTYAMNYVIKAKGLVQEPCFPYQARDMPCPTKCKNGDDWKKAHICDCKEYKIADTCAKLKTALTDGSVTLGFGVCRSFFNYKSGIYKCDCGGSYAGLHAVEGVGFGEEEATKKMFLHVKNSWGTNWGMKGFFDIYCDTCGIGGQYPKGNVYCSKF